MQTVGVSKLLGLTAKALLRRLLMVVHCFASTGAMGKSCTKSSESMNTLLPTAWSWAPAAAVKPVLELLRQCALNSGCAINLQHHIAAMYGHLPLGVF
jgi:hypothetical protein